MCKIDVKVKTIADDIIRILEDAGVYEKSLIFQVELVAGDILAYRKVRNALLNDGEDATFPIERREGDTIIKINPLFAELRLQSKSVREGLDKLTMNIKSKKNKADTEDGLSKLADYILREDKDNEKIGDPYGNDDIS